MFYVFSLHCNLLSLSSLQVQFCITHTFSLIIVYIIKLTVKIGFLYFLNTRCIMFKFIWCFVQEESSKFLYRPSYLKKWKVQINWYCSKPFQQMIKTKRQKQNKITMCIQNSYWPCQVFKSVTKLFKIVSWTL